MLGDRVCPSCQVLLREGTSTCVKCGRKVEPEPTGFVFLDFPPKIYSRLVHRFGPVGAIVVAALAFLILLFLWIGWLVIESLLDQ